MFFYGMLKYVTCTENRVRTLRNTALTLLWYRFHSVIVLNDASVKQNYLPLIYHVILTIRNC